MSPTGPRDITAAALAVYERCNDPRLRRIMHALTAHLHAFAQEVELTEGEWRAGINALTATGEITDQQRQEFMLWSDTLGLSMLVNSINHGATQGGTESTVLGPFYVPGSPVREPGSALAMHAAGTPAWISGHVLDLAGGPIAGAELDVWQNGENQLYAVQDPDAPEHHLRGRFVTGEDGDYAFLAVRPTPYPIPHDGPVGAMLQASGRHPWRPAHIHVIVRAPGHATLTTHLFDAESPYLESDAVFAVKPSLVRKFVARPPEDPQRPAGVEGPWCSLETDFVLPPGTP